MKKLISVLVCVFLLCSMITACASDSGASTSSAENSGNDAAGDSSSAEVDFDEDPVDLTLVYMVATTFAEQDDVSAAMAELALKEMNVNLSVIPMTFGVRDEQLQLMLTSGEPLDIFPQNSNQMASYVDSGYVIDLSEYKDIMPNTMKWVGEADLNCCNVGGYVWGVTTMRERANPNGIVMRKDILDDIGVSIDDIKTLDDMTEVYAKVKEKYPDMVCYGGTSTMGLGHQSDMAGTHDPLNDELGVLANYGEDNLTVINEFESDSFIELVKTCREWWNAGYISKDMPTSTDSGEALMAAGNLFSYQCNLKPNTAAEKKSQTGYDVVTFMVTDPVTTTTSTNGLGFCVSGTSENPEKAVAFLDWLVGSGEMNDLMNFGIEGVHWVEAEDGTATYPEGVSLENCGYHLDWGWAIPNQFAGHLWEGNDPDMYESYVEFQNNAHHSKAYGFSFDSSNVVNEVIACQAVLTEYLPGLTIGSVDVETELAAMNEALYAAGLQKVMDEKQAQLDAWAEEHGVS